MGGRPAPASSVVRGRAVVALRDIVAECDGIIARGVAVNDAIRAGVVSVPTLDLVGVADTRHRAAQMLIALESRRA